MQKLIKALKAIWKFIVIQNGRFIDCPIWSIISGKLKAIWKFVLKYNEWFFSFPIGYLIFYYGTKRMFMSGLGVYDIGVSQKLLIGTAFLFFILGMARIMQKLQWPGLSKLNDEDTNEKWNEISPSLRYIYSLVTWSVIVLSLSILVAKI